MSSSNQKIARYEGDFELRVLFQSRVALVILVHIIGLLSYASVATSDLQTAKAEDRGRGWQGATEVLDSSLRVHGGEARRLPAAAVEELYMQPEL